MAKKEATTKESPQLPDDPTKEAAEGQALSPQQDNAGNTEAELAEVMGMLKQFEINSPEKVENVVRASQQTGRMAQLLGEQRETNRQLMAKLEAIEKRNAQNYSASEGYEEKPIDLEGTIEGVISRVLEREKRKQTEMTQRQWAAYNEIQADEDYSLVKDAWDNYVRQPEVIYSFQSGTADPVKEYNKFVRKFQRKLLQRTRGLLEQVTTGTKKIAPLHMEQGTNVPPMPTEPTDFMEKKKAIQQKYKGKPSAGGISELLNELIPDGDPLLVRR